MNSYVYTVIPVHNRRDYTEACLRCLHHQTWPNLRVILVDDGSTDGTSEMIRSEFPGKLVIPEFHHVLHGPMIPLDLSLRHGMIGSALRMLHALLYRYSLNSLDR